MKIVLANQNDYEIIDFNERIAYNDEGNINHTINFEVVNPLNFAELKEIFTNENVFTFTVKPTYGEPIRYEGMRIVNINYTMNNNQVRREIRLR